jgi:hypothetical protein
MVKVSKHDGIRLSKVEAMHPSTCPMNFGCDKIKYINDEYFMELI